MSDLPPTGARAELLATSISRWEAEPSHQEDVALARVGAVICAYGSRKSLELRLQLIEQGLAPGNIVIVENPKAGIVSLEADEARILHRASNGGYASAINDGLLVLLAEHIDAIFALTDDVELVDGCIINLLNELRADAIGIAGPILLDRTSGQTFSCGGGLAGNWLPFHHRDIDPTVSFTEREWLDGAVLAIRSDLIKEIGLPDDRFFLYVEDVEYCTRAREAGWKVGVAAGALALQHPGGHLKPLTFQYLMARNQLSFAISMGGTMGFVRSAFALVKSIARQLVLQRPTKGALVKAAVAATMLAWGALDAVRHRLNAPPRVLLRKDGIG